MLLRERLTLFASAVAILCCVPFGSSSQYPGSGSGAANLGYNYGQPQSGWQDQSRGEDYQRPESSKPPLADHEKPALPSGWSEHRDPASGQMYYYNAEEGTTTWDRPSMPEEPKAEPEPSHLEIQEDSFGMGGPSGNRPTEQDETGPTSCGPSGYTQDNEQSTFQSPGSMYDGGDGGATGAPQQDGGVDPNKNAQQQLKPPMDVGPDHGRRDGPGPGGRPDQGWGVPGSEPNHRETFPDDTRWGSHSDDRGDAGIRGADSSGPMQRDGPQLEQKEQPGLERTPPMGAWEAPDEGGKGEASEQVRHDSAQGGTPPRQDSPWGQERGSQPAAQQQRLPLGRHQNEQGQERPAPQQPEVSRSGLFAPPQQRQHQQGPPHGAPQRRPDERFNQQRPLYPQQPEQQKPPGQTGLPGPGSEAGNTQEQRPPFQGSPYGRGPPPQGNVPYGQYGQYGQPPQSGQYGQNQYQRYGYGEAGANQYGQQQGYGQVVDASPQPSAVREALGSAWQGLLGFGNRTKEAVDTARNTVVAGAKEATETLSTRGSCEYAFICTILYSFCFCILILFFRRRSLVGSSKEHIRVRF